MNEPTWLVYWWRRGLNGSMPWQEIAMICFGAASAVELNADYLSLFDLAMELAANIPAHVDVGRGAAARTHNRRSK